MSPTELRVLDATKVCCERWGIAKVTIDDIAAEAGVSRATLYRMFPGGKDVLFDALRVRELEDFFTFTELSAHIDGVDDLEELLVRTVVYATTSLRNDEHLALMLASEPGDTLANLTVQGLPRIIRMAALFLAPKVEPYLDRASATRLVDLLARLVISYFLAPSDHVDLGDETSARGFVTVHVLPTFVPFDPASSPSGAPS
ncbi:MAG: TetR/AcrR family transcriptional regulator [Acidimicrobiales bacterium]|nr:TetR/AcrR family transcriptional regulator [Acidimicrobiales bacterium]MCB9395356.1 TetR/AcrR family transcriptional regulator [Acidimicrobiaceae bacterium]